jgi:hypothetical protein
MNDQLKTEMISVENDDPALFEELSLKRKWSNVVKDPIKALRD